ncbi:MATE family efflux transporter [Mongoliibacter ruber]
MFLVMGITLYMSRIVLEQLGVSDYGIYSLVGGIVALFGFLNSSMSSATQRYLAFDLGKKDEKKLQKTFSVTLTIHFAIAFIILFFAETIGLWYLNYHVVLPPDRLFAANIVYQFSVLTALIGIIQVPYDSLIIAYEKMNIYAYISIVEVCLKLGLVFLLVVYGGDKLIAYSVMIFLVSFIVRIAYQVYCRRNYTASKYSFKYDKIYFKELINFSGWSLFGNLAVILKIQGINVILNLFYGLVVNSAYALTQQVNTAVYLFITNFQKAVNPQIIKAYSSDDISKMHHLILISSKYSYFLIFIITIPVILNINYVLSLWLKVVPPHTNVFVILILISSLFESMSGPLIKGIQSSGKIKNYQIFVSIVFMAPFPIAYFLLSDGMAPESVFYSIVVSHFCALGIRCYFCQRLIGLKIIKFIEEVIFKTILVTFLSLLILFLFGCFNSYTQSFSNFLIDTLIIEVVVILVVFLIGMTNIERKKIFSFIKSKVYPLC